MTFGQTLIPAPVAHHIPRPFVWPADTGTSRGRHRWLPLLLLSSMLGIAACGSDPIAPAAASSGVSAVLVPFTAAPASLVLSNANEPAGYAEFGDNQYDTRPTWPRSLGGTSGSWYNYPAVNGNLTLLSDPGAPVSPGNVIRTRFYTGQVAGVGPVNMGGWDATGVKAFRKVYFSLWMKIEGPDFENQKTGTKAGFFGVGTAASAQNQCFFMLHNGTGVQRLQSDFQVVFMQQGIKQPNGSVTRNITPNVNRTHLMTAGGWHHWEVVMEVNTIGTANGIFKMWIDGAQTHNYSNVVYITAATPKGFNTWKWNPTWGGTGGVRTRNDYIDIDQVHLSGTI